jgi:hypothetical protein
VRSQLPLNRDHCHYPIFFPSFSRLTSILPTSYLIYPLTHLTQPRCIFISNGGYECSCNGTGWSTGGTTRQSCIGPLDGCARTDYCLSQKETLNTCVNLANGFHECTCNGRGYVLPIDKQTCIAPINPCTSRGRDLCSSAIEPLNACRSAGTFDTFKPFLVLTRFGALMILYGRSRWHREL